MNIDSALTSGLQELDGCQRPTISILGRASQATDTAEGYHHAESHWHQFCGAGTASTSSFELAAVDTEAGRHSRRAESEWNTGLQARLAEHRAERTARYNNISPIASASHSLWVAKSSQVVLGVGTMHDTRIVCQEGHMCRALLEGHTSLFGRKVLSTLRSEGDLGTAVIDPSLIETFISSQLLSATVHDTLRRCLSPV